MYLPGGSKLIVYVPLLLVFAPRTVPNVNGSRACTTANGTGWLLASRTVPLIVRGASGDVKAGRTKLMFPVVPGLVTVTGTATLKVTMRFGSYGTAPMWKPSAVPPGV